MPDLLQLISEQTPAVALALVIMYFYNKLVLDMVKERKEIIETLRNERKEWVDSARLETSKLHELIRLTIEANMALKNEVYDLKNRLLEYISQRRNPKQGE